MSGRKRKYYFSKGAHIQSKKTKKNSFRFHSCKKKKEGATVGQTFPTDPFIVAHQQTNTKTHSASITGRFYSPAGRVCVVRPGSHFLFPFDFFRERETDSFSSFRAKSRKKKKKMGRMKNSLLHQGRERSFLLPLFFEDGTEPNNSSETNQLPTRSSVIIERRKEFFVFFPNFIFFLNKKRRRKNFNSLMKRL